VPRLEELEARLTPVTVNSLADMLAPPPPGMVTLRSAITFGATSIDFAPNVSGTINLVATLPTLKGVTINNATGNSIQLLGNWTFRLIETQGGTTNEIDNLQMDQGGGVAGGGGIDNNGSLTLNGCYMSLNEATDGGAISNNASATLTLVNTTLFEDHADNTGGGIWNSADGQVNIYSGSVIESCSATNGGGIGNNGDLTITDSVLVKDNGASSYGGGIYNATNGTVTMGASTLTTTGRRTWVAASTAIPAP
jgi:hypothetical protein